MIRRPKIKLQWSPMNFRKFCALAIFAVSTTSALADSLTYSGIQDVVLNGVPGGNQSVDIRLLGVASPADTLRIIISDNPGFGDPYLGSILILPGTAEVGMIHGTGVPVAIPLQSGNPYPTSALSIGSGSTILYGLDTTLGDGDYYYALGSDSSNLTGWIQLVFKNTNSSSESITAVDWAVTTDPDVQLAMGQGQVGVTPEPASWLLMGSAGAAGLLARLRSLRAR
jgi:hypothetical protein